jgi:hypothetical protein
MYTIMKYFKIMYEQIMFLPIRQLIYAIENESARIKAFSPEI